MSPGDSERLSVPKVTFVNDLTEVTIHHLHIMGEYIMSKELKYDIRVLRCNMCGRVWERDDDDPFAPQCCPNCSASNTTTERIIQK